MLGKRFHELEKADIESLVENGVSEGKSIEYKLVTPQNNDDNKKEFLGDVSSFANAGGGDLLYGIDELRDENKRPTGIPAALNGLGDINVDQEILRLENIIRDGIEPRIPGVQIRALNGFQNGPIIIIRVPRSWAAPHMVTFKGSSRFFSRTNAGKAPLDVAEIRAAFLQSEAIPERMKRFRDERLARIIADETPQLLLPNGKIVVHYLPVESFASPKMLDMKALQTEFANLPPLYASGWNHRLNLDGLLTYSSSSSRECIGYTQLFRTGAIETVDAGLLAPEEDGSRTIPTIAYEQQLRQHLKVMIEFYKQQEFSAPVIVFITMIGVLDYELTLTPRHRRILQDSNRIDRDVLLLPEITIEDFGQSPDIILRPVFDMVWQAAGLSGSTNFDENGNWIRR